jgi:glycosyltransferase involved in cell wall biosynthesis
VTIEDEVAADVIDGRLQINFAPIPRMSARRRLRRLMRSSATVYRMIQRLRGRSYTREDILRIRDEEFAVERYVPRQTPAGPLPISRVPHDAASLDPETLVVSGGLDWEFKDVRGLRLLKQRHGFRYCTIVHDIICILFPHFIVPRLVGTLTDYFAELAQLADHAMCNSQATRRDWLAYCGGLGVDMPAHVFPLGCDLPEEGAQAELPAALQGKRFALFVSTIEPRKNHRMLYEAWDRCMRSKTVDRERDRLVFVGRRGWAVDDLMRELAANPATRDTILVLNHVPDALLGTLYRHCALVLFPSFYEGYGIPVAEALNHGKPCISSDAGSLPEIGGDLVLRLDPKDTLRWAQAIARYLTSAEELAAWGERIRTQHRPVTWDDAASRFFGTIKEVVP